MWMRFMIICRRLRKSAISLSMSSTSLISEREALNRTGIFGGSNF
jgi:hypothetical protein